MKKITFLLSLILCVVLFGCGKSEPVATEIPETPSPTPEFVEITPDPSVPEGYVKYQLEELYFYVPGDYVEGMLDTFQVLYTSQYPEVNDCILFNTTLAAKIKDYGKNAVATKLKANVEGYQKLISYEKVKLAGVETVKVVFQIKNGDTTFNETQYYMFHEKRTYIISISDFSGQSTKPMQAIVQSAFFE